MVIQKAIELFNEHQKGNVKKSTLKSYGKFLEHFREQYSGCEVISVSADHIGRFLDECTEGLSRSTRHRVMLKLRMPSRQGNYSISACVRNAGSPVRYEACGGMVFTVTES